jgi:hypothetical protein
MDKIASQIKVLLLFGMVGVNEVGIRWKDNALIRGGLTDASNSFFFYERSGVKLAVRSQQTP